MLTALRELWLPFESPEALDVVYFAVVGVGEAESTGVIPAVDFLDELRPPHLIGAVLAAPCAAFAVWRRE